jgi:predicted nuclease of restriction endonuclease-like (RecB) superfamily
MSNWLVGREIVEDEQLGKRRAAYRERTLQQLARRLTEEFGSGFSAASLKKVRQFYVAYPDFLSSGQIGYALRIQFNETRGQAEPGFLDLDAADASWQPGRANPNLSWGHYRVLMRLEDSRAQSFYELESIKISWSARELERQTASLLFERLAKSRDKIGVMRLATEGAEPEKPAEIFKDPTVIEFLGLPETPALTESSLESALLSNLQSFLLELGRSRVLPLGVEVLCAR